MRKKREIMQIESIGVMNNYKTIGVIKEIAEGEIYPRRKTKNTKKIVIIIVGVLGIKC